MKNNSFEYEAQKDPAKFYEVETFNQNTKQIYYSLSNDDDYYNKIIFFNGTLGKFKGHNSRYIHFEPYERILYKNINTSTIYYNDDEERNYYKFNKTNGPLQKILYKKFRINIYIFEPDDQLFNKTFITTKRRGGGQHLEKLINDTELINDTFRTHLKYHVDNVMSSVHFSTTLSGNYKGASYINEIGKQKQKFKEAFKLATADQLKEHINIIYPVPSYQTKEHYERIEKINNIIDEIKRDDKNEERKQFIKENNERYERRRQQDDEELKILSTPAPTQTKHINILEEFQTKLKEAIKKDNINEDEINEEFKNRIRNQIKEQIINDSINMREGDEIIIRTGMKTPKYNY
jgi:hypothetical protein